MSYNREVVTEWVRRLRSGDYTQGKGYLAIRRDGDAPVTHCCLGVLCEIAAEKNIVDTQIGSSMDGTIREFSFSGTLPPQEVREFAGVAPVDNWEVTVPAGLSATIDLDYGPGHGGKVALVALNDDYGFSFEEIADLLEAEHLRD